MVKLVIDMMGGNNGVNATVPAVKKLLNDFDDLFIVAVGEEDKLAELKDEKNVKIIPSKTIVPMECSVMQAMRMKDSSVNIAVNSVKNEQADGIISAGSTGAFLSLTTLILKKLDGVDRPALISPFPTLIENKYVVLLDIGASNENKAHELVQFAKMGQAYCKVIYNNDNPNFYLASNGAEEGKGSPVGQEAYTLMKEMEGFKGNIEARYVLKGDADVVVFDGYSGNIFLKSSEGMAKMMSSLMKDMFKTNIFSKIGYLLSKKGVKKMRDKMDYKKVGGALLIGVNTIPVKAHGNSDAESFYYSCLIAYRLAKKNLIKELKEKLN